MFYAVGASVHRLGGGQFEIGVDYYADDSPKVVLTQTYVVVDKQVLLQKVQQQLQQLKQNADDVATQMDIVGQQIGSI